MLEFTTHAQKRMNQRGISKDMIELTLEFGKYMKDKVILNFQQIKKLLSKVSIDVKSRLLKIMDKGGLVVVLSDRYSVITVYNKYR